MSLGAHPDGALTHFRAFSDVARAMSLRLFDPDGGARATLPMERVGSEGFFTLSLPNAGEGTLYKFVLGLDGQHEDAPFAHGAAEPDVTGAVIREEVLVGLDPTLHEVRDNYRPELRHGQRDSVVSGRS